MGIISKLYKAFFVKLRMDADSNILSHALKEVLVSAMYAEQQGAYLNAYHTGLNNSDSETILKEYWDIHTPADAVDTLQYLLDKGHRYYLDAVYTAAFEQKDNYDKVLENAFTDPADLQKAVQLFRSLRTCVDALITDGVITKKEDIKKYNVYAWDYGRLVFIARLCYEKQLLSDTAFRGFLKEALIRSKSHFRNWEDFSKSYIIGRSIWGGQDNSGMISISKTLLTNEKSPWVQNPL